MKDMKLRFKDGVYGFVFDGWYGEINNIITEPISENDVKFFNRTSDEYMSLFTDVDSVVEFFGLENKDIVNGSWDNILELEEDQGLGLLKKVELRNISGKI
jgi:hypothetical protein